MLSILVVLLPYQTRNLALDNASAGFVALVSALIPLGTAVVAHFMLSNERLKAPILVGLMLGLGGVAVLLLGGDSGIAEGGNPPVAGVFALASVVSVSVAAVYAKRYAGHYSVLAVTGVQLALGGAGLALIALILEGIPDSISPAGGISVAYVGLMGNLVPLALYFLLIRHVTVTYSAITRLHRAVRRCLRRCRGAGRAGPARNSRRGCAGPAGRGGHRPGPYPRRPARDGRVSR